MKKLLALIIVFSVSILLWNCKNDNDPAPDLSSSKISFLWDFTPATGATFYAVVADTSGNVLKWDQIVPGTVLDLPYPPDPKLATVTLITRATTGSTRATILNTFTGLASGQYTLKPDADVKPRAKEGVFKLGLMDPTGNFVTPYMTGNYEYISLFRDKALNYTLSYGVYNNEVNNFFLWGSKTSTADEIKYLYVQNVKAGDSVGVSTQSFDNDFKVMPFHNVTYPGHKTSALSNFTVTGLTIDNSAMSIDSRTLPPSSDPKVAYPEIANLFKQYQTEMTAYDNFGGSFYEKNTSKDPDLSFSNMNTKIDKVITTTTKRIALDASGDGDMVYIESQFGADSDPVVYAIFAPMASKVRMNLPQFPQELIDKIGNLATLKDKSFEYVYTDEYNMSYGDFFQFWIDNDLFGFPDNMRSRGFAIDGGSGRKALDSQDILKRYTRKRPVDF